MSELGCGARRRSVAGALVGALATFLLGGVAAPGQAVAQELVQLEAPASCLAEGTHLVAPTDLGVRGRDVHGEGKHDASRGHGARRHEGIDFIATPGIAIRAPVAGRVSRLGRPYADSDEFALVEIEMESGCKVVVFYVQPLVRVGDSVAAGDTIGLSQNLDTRYSGICPHVHLEVRRGATGFVERLDPTPLFAEADVRVNATFTSAYAR
jgi:murein DD-endopeptidase MepM/ murein hydrolase activator NlpD